MYISDLCRKNNRRYFSVSFDSCSHNMRVSYVKLIPSVKIRRDVIYSGYYQMMIGCNGEYCDILLFELNKAKRNDDWVNFKEIL